MAGHNDRSHPPSNADPNRTIQWLLPDPETDAWDRIQARVNRLPNAKVRANSVMAMSMILSASPEYFGDWEVGETKTNAWIESSMQWLKDEFGDLVTGAWAHYDEKTPHIHAHVIPGTKDGRLSAKQRFGRIALRAYQTGYALSVSHLGIQRGIAGSKARHTTTQQWYSDAEKGLNQVVIPVPPLTNREQYVKDLTAQIIERERIIMSHAQGRHLAEDRAREMADTADAKESELVVLRQERNQLRDIDLCDVLDASGWHRNLIDSGQYMHPYGAGNGLITVAKTQWMDSVTDRYGEGSIELAMHLHGFSQTSESLGWLRDEFGTKAAECAFRAHANKEAHDVIEFAPSPFKRPRIATSEISAFDEWLIKVKRIRAELAEMLIENGAVYGHMGANGLAYAAWPYMYSRGAELTEISERGLHFTAPGSQPTKDFWRFDDGPCPERLIVAESALDAIAYYQLNPGPVSTVISTSGARTKPPGELAEMAEEYKQVVVAYGRNKSTIGCGTGLAKWLGGTHHPPPLVFERWSDALTQGDPGQPQARPTAPDQADRFAKVLRL